MELSKVIVGTKLNEIQKKSDGVKLVFENTDTQKVYVLTFKGLLFETSTPTLDRRVKTVKLNNVLGFRAISQLRNLKRDPNSYRQLFIQMDESNDNNKLELIGALTNYRVSLRKKAIAKSKSETKISLANKAVVKKG